MLHAKFQSPSIYIDRYFQLSDSVSDSVSDSISQWHTQEKELCTWPEARGTAYKAQALISAVLYNKFQIRWDLSKYRGLLKDITWLKSPQNMTFKTSVFPRILVV